MKHSCKEIQHQSHLNGQWVNDYGSLMDLKVSASGEVFGIYRSTTGGSGSYYVYGFQAALPWQADKGQGVTLVISWKPFKYPSSEKPDASWRWMSTYCGQLVPTTTGETPPSLNVINDFIVTSHLEGMSLELGSYLDKLSFRASDQHSSGIEDIEEALKVSKPTDSVFNGVWKTPDGKNELDLQVLSSETGWTMAKYKSPQGEIEMKGFTDPMPKEADLKRHSIALAGRENTYDGAPVSLSGYIDANSGQLELNIWAGLGTDMSSQYLETRVNSLTFVRYLA